MRKISFIAALLSLCAAALHAAQGGGGTPTPLPPSAVLFSNNTFHFYSPTDTFTAAVSAPADGAWLTGSAKWSTDLLFGWDCSHSYTADLSPNNNDYAPLFIAGWTAAGICTDQYPVYGCLNCGIDWGGVKHYQYMTTDNRPGFLAPGGGTVTLRTNNGGGQDDHLTIYVQQVNRDAMVNMTIFQSDDVDDPSPADSTEVQSRYFIANSADRVPVVPVFHYGVNANGGDIQYPAGPSVTYVATWDTGQTSTPDIAFAPAAKAVHGHTILGLPIPKMATGKHTFTVTAKLPSGKTYTTPSMEVLVYAQTIYVTYGAFDPKNPQDDLPKFVPGADVNGNNVDLLNGLQTMQLNILVGRGSSGTFDVHLRNVTHYPGIAMNYPIGAASPDPNPDIDFGSGDIDLLGVPIPKGGAPKVVKLPLEIHDYAGAATIEVTMPYRKTTFTAKRRIPLDGDGNGLPDAGWRANTGVAVSTAGLQATDDLELDPPATGLPFDTIAGDGLSAFEEYRGFFIAGAHVRLDPNKKQVFVVADPVVLTDPVAVTWITKLPFATLFAEASEIAGSTNFARGWPLSALKAEINPNRAGVPGARSRAHRALRLVWAPVKPADYFVSATSTIIPVWQRGIHGITWNDGMPDIDLFNSPNNNPVNESPDATQFVEVMTAADRNAGIATDFSDPGGYHDANGILVQPCGVAPPGGPCDDWDLTRGLIVPHVQLGGWAKLQTVVDPILHLTDYYSQYSFTCGIPNLTEVVGRMSASDMSLQPYRTMIHELGHNLQLVHVADPLNDCHDLMYDNQLLPPNRRTFLDIVPLTNDYSRENREQMRLWQP